VGLPDPGLTRQAHDRQRSAWAHGRRGDQPGNLADLGGPAGEIAGIRRKVQQGPAMSGVISDEFTCRRRSV